MRATFLPARSEHEVVNNELALAAEQIGERHLARRPVENVFLFDFEPRQLATLEIQGVALFGELLFFHEKLFAGSEPFFLRNDFAVFDAAGGFDFRHNGLLCFIWDIFQTSAAPYSCDPTGARLTSPRPFAG